MLNDRLNASTRLICVLGSPISHSLSPVLMNRLIEHFKKNLVYMAFSPTQLGVAIDGLRELGFIGANITIPFKEKVVDYCDIVDPLAEEAQAVNTITYNHGVTIGFNTDVIGIQKSLEKYLSQIDSFVVFGAGGAARALCVALKNKHGTIVNRSTEKGKQLAEEFGLEFVSLQDGVNHLRVDLLVNATPLGMQGFSTEEIIPQTIITNSHFVFDMVYNPEITPLIKKAIDNSVTYITGMDMFLYQARESFNKWTDCNPDIELMRNIMTTIKGSD